MIKTKKVKYGRMRTKTDTLYKTTFTRIKPDRIEGRIVSRMISLKAVLSIANITGKNNMIDPIKLEGA